MVALFGLVLALIAACFWLSGSKLGRTIGIICFGLPFEFVAYMSYCTKYAAPEFGVMAYVMPPFSLFIAGLFAFLIGSAPKYFRDTARPSGAAAKVVRR